jgi:hypothetical protein
MQRLIPLKKSFAIQSSTGGRCLRLKGYDSYFSWDQMLCYRWNNEWTLVEAKTNKTSYLVRLITHERKNDRKKILVRVASIQGYINH